MPHTGIRTAKRERNRTHLRFSLHRQCCWYAHFMTLHVEGPCYTLIILNVHIIIIIIIITLD